MRLDKLVSHGAGISRKQAADAIRSRRVLVGGQVVTRPETHCDPAALITLDGNPIVAGNRYYMLNKPSGVVCSTRDLKDPTVLELLPAPLRKGLFPAGRLDKDTEGFVLLTNDGAFAHRMLSPKKKIGKVYRVTLDAPFSLETLQQAFSQPMDLGKGDITSPAQLRLLEEGNCPVAELIIYEGRFHQVKRMFGRFGLGVIALKRTAIGGLALDPNLAPGQWKSLTQQELSQVFSDSDH
ncbi:MAG: pseudouridine synthase [Oscillospiraceae bacterium]|jgi:16S rRNA pseudouridine516 synthase